MWGALGIALGSFVIWAPFIPIWSKEWVLPFTIAGLIFPNIRRFLMMRRYERELNQLVSRADREIARIDTAYLTSGDAIEARLAEDQSEDESRSRVAAGVAARKQGES
jgi:hypothetical protein